MVMFNHLPGEHRRQLLGGGFTAVALGAIGIWMFSRCAAPPDDRCLDDSLRPEPAGMVSAERGCMLCYCDARGELRCLYRSCRLDGGVVSDVAD